jgi:hypothetical protein
MSKKLKAHTLKELSQRLVALEPQELLFFYDRADSNDDDAIAYGAKRISNFNADMILVNCCGGGAPLLLDISQDEFDDCHEAMFFSWAEDYDVGPTLYYRERVNVFTK